MSDINMTIIKRDGSRVPYNNEKIQNAVAKALMASGEVATKRVSTSAQIIGLLVECELFDDPTAARNGQMEATVEHIQDLVEAALMEQGLPKTAKAYILYRQQHTKMRETRNAILDVKKTIEGYVGPNKDWRVKENATVSLSLGGLILSNSGAITSNYWLSEIYDEEVANAHRNADMHIHDLSMLSGYCAGWSLRQLITEGLGGVEGRITSSPAAHLSTLCNQMVNFLGIMQNEWAGAQAFSSFDTYLAPFVRADNLSYKEVKQCIQSFVYGVNTPSRWGTQPPFTNITLDWVVPDDMAHLPAIVGGKEMPFTYGDCKAEMDMVNKAFIEIMVEGDANGRGFQYPIPTYSITKDFDWSDTENNRLLFEMTAKYGTPYFSNYINSDMQPSDVRSMCCRLRLDLRELRKKSGGFFGSGESTGSIGVVTLNLPRMAYQSKDEADFYSRLDHLMDVAARSLDTKRKVITRLMDEGLYPYTKRYLGSFDNHFSTIGLVGMNEAARNANWLCTDLTTPAGQEFAKAVLNHMRERLSDYQEQYGVLFNLEATPAESTTYRFAKHDKEDFPDIITAAKAGGDPRSIPTAPTSPWAIPMMCSRPSTCRMTFRPCTPPVRCSTLSLESGCRTGRPQLLWCGRLQRITGFRITRCLRPTRSARSTAISVGEQYTCPICGKATEVYSRITGYYRPLKNWNDGKAEEFKERKTYKVGEPMTGKIDVRAIKQNHTEKDPECQETGAEALTGVTLFATRTCPNCRLAKEMLNKAGIQYDVVYADENPELAKAYGIMSAPTLLVPAADGSGFDRYMNASNIRQYITQRNA